MPKPIDFERFYSFFGCEFSPATSDNVKSDCPFFDCPNPDSHFFVDIKTGQFQCKKCGKSGNHYSFMTQYHKLCLEQTTDEHYEELKEIRGIPAEVIKLAKWAINPYGVWHVPYYAMTTSNLVSIGRFNPHTPNAKNKFRIFKAPEVPLVLYRLFESPKIGNDVIITEGEHDIKAIYAAYRANKVKPGSTLMASPGNNWKKEWNKQLAGKNVMFFTDDDAGGADFQESIAKHAKGFNYSFANWTVVHNYWQESFGEEFDGKDPRDVWNKLSNKTEALPLFIDMMEEATTAVEGTPEDIETRSAYTTDIAEIEPLSSRKLFQSRIREAMYTNTSIMQSIDLVLASCISVLVPGEPIWVFLYGPPSCGKSLLIEAFGGSNDYFEYASKVTATSLVSGWKPQNGEEDSSTLPKINLKTLFIKDLTVLLGMPEAVQQQLWDLLRDAYDGFIKVIFGNGKTFTATGIKFGIVAGVTNAIHARNDSDMGERFLKIDYLGSSDKFSEDEHMDAAWESMDKKKENKKLLLDTVLGYYKHLVTDFSVDKLVPGSQVDPAIRNKLKRLAQLVAKLRAKVVKDRHEGMKMRPVPEVATRLFLQFGVLIRCLAYVRQDKTVTEDTYIAFRKIAFDSTNGLNLEVIEYLYKHKGASRYAMINDLRIPSTRMHQILSDFDQLNIISKTKEENGKGGGRDSFRYTLSDEIMECLDVSKPARRKKAVPKALPKKSSSQAKKPTKKLPTKKKKVRS